MPRGDQRRVDSAFIIFIPGRCGCPKNRNSETAVDRFDLSRRGSGEQFGSERLHGDMEMLRPAAAFIRECLRPLVLGLQVSANPAFGKHCVHYFDGVAERKRLQRSGVAAGKREMPQS